jgi:hypothetical protein
MSTSHSPFINKLKKPLNKGTLSPFLYESFKEYQIQRSLKQENNSVEIQRAHILEYAGRKGLSVPDEFIIIEDDTSAYNKRANQRKELMRLKEMMLETIIPTVGNLSIFSIPSLMLQET